MIEKILFTIFITISMCIFSQKKISIDEKGKIITEAEFQKKWRDFDLDLYRWDYMKNGKRICTLKRGQVQYCSQNYDETLNILKKKLDTVFTKNAIVVLDFHYYNDICSERFDEHWESSELREIKEFNRGYLNNIQKILRENSQNLYIFYIYEKKSIVKKEKTNYYKSFIEDFDDFFRENFFREQAMCGSYLTITPSGILLYNGEANIGLLLEKYIK